MLEREREKKMTMSFDENTNGVLVSDPYGNRYYVHAIDGFYLGMGLSEDRLSSDSVLMYCECNRCGERYVSTGGNRQCPSCDGADVILVGDEVSWVRFSQLQSLFGLYSVTTVVISPRGGLLAAHDTVDDEEVAVFEDEVSRYVAQDLESAIFLARSRGFAPGDGSGIDMILAPAFDEAEGRVLESWEGPGWYGFASRFVGCKSQEGDSDPHPDILSKGTYCEDVYDFGRLVGAWCRDNDDLLWVGKLG